MMLGVTAEQIPERDAELSALTGSLGFLFNRPEPRVVFTQLITGALRQKVPFAHLTAETCADFGSVWAGPDSSLFSVDAGMQLFRSAPEYMTPDRFPRFDVMCSLVEYIRSRPGEWATTDDMEAALRWDAGERRAERGGLLAFTRMQHPYAERGIVGFDPANEEAQSRRARSNPAQPRPAGRPVRCRRPRHTRRRAGRCASSTGSSQAVSATALLRDSAPTGFPRPCLVFTSTPGLKLALPRAARAS
jgi:hypothetical protein